MSKPLRIDVYKKHTSQKENIDHLFDAFRIGVTGFGHQCKKEEYDGELYHFGIEGSLKYSSDIPKKNIEHFFLENGVRLENRDYFGFESEGFYITMRDDIDSQSINYYIMMTIHCEDKYENAIILGNKISEALSVLLGKFNKYIRE